MLLRHREPKRDEARLSPLREAGRQAGRAMAQEGDGVLQEASWLFSIFSVKEQIWGELLHRVKGKVFRTKKKKKKMIKGSTINKKIDKNGKK